MKKSSKAKKWLYIGGIAALIIVFVLLVLIIVWSKRSATLDILVTPISARVMVDGKDYENGIYKFEPGEINVTIEKEGFKTEERTIVLLENSVTKLYIYLVPLDGSFDWYLSHDEDMMLLNAIGDAVANENSKNYLEDYPIVNALPIIYATYDEDWEYTEFRIDGGTFENCKQAFCLKVTDTTGGNLENALKLIREQGFSPEDYEIIYEYKPIEPLE